MIMSNGGQPSNNNPWLLNAQFKSNGKLFNDNAMADTSADPSAATNGKKYGLKRNLPDNIVDNLGLTNEEMSTVQAELSKVDGTPVLPYQKQTGLNRYLPLGMQENLGKLKPAEQAKVDAEIARMQQYAQPRQLATDTFQLGLPRSAAEATTTAATAQPFNPTAFGGGYSTLATEDSYQPQQQPLEETNTFPTTPAPADPSQQLQQPMTPEQAMMLQQLLAGQNGSGATGVPQGPGGVKGMAQNAGSTALTVLEKTSEGASSLAKSFIFGNPDITAVQMAGTVGAGLVIANAGGFAINKMHGYDFAGGMSLTDKGNAAVYESPVGKLARLVDKAPVGFKGADGRSFSAGYLDNVKWMPDTVKRVLGNNQALVNREITLADGTKQVVSGDIKQYFNTFFDHMLGETEFNASTNKHEFKTRGMVAENGNIVPLRFREQFEAIITPDRLHHIKNMTIDVTDHKMMGHMTHKLLEQVSTGGWGEGFFSAENLPPLTSRKELIEKLYAAHNSLLNDSKMKAFATLPKDIDIATLLKETDGQVSPHLQHLFKAEVAEQAYKMDDGSFKKIMEKPFISVQKNVPVWTSEAQIEVLKKEAYHLYSSDFGAANPRGIAHDAVKALKNAEKGILPPEGFFGNVTNGVKSVASNLPFSNEAREVFWKDKWADVGGKRDLLIAQLEEPHRTAFENLYGKDIYAKNITALKETKTFYQFQEAVRGMHHEAKHQLDLGWKAGEFYDNILSRAKQMCAEDTGPRVMTAKAVEHMKVSGLGRVVPTFTHWFKNMWIGNPFEHLSGMLETAHFSNQKGKGLEKLGKAIIGSGSFNNRMTRVGFLFGAMMAFTQAIGASFKEKNPKFTSMPSATEGNTLTGKPPAVGITSLPQVPEAIGSNIASATGLKGFATGNNAMVNNNYPQPYQFTTASQQTNGAEGGFPPVPTGYATVTPRKTAETSAEATPLPPETMATVAQPAYKPNAGDMSRAFGREFISAGLGFMVFMGLFNSINTQTQWLTKAMGRFGPQTFKWPIPVLGPVRMNWLGAAINLGGTFFIMPMVSNTLLGISDKVFGKPQYLKVEEAVKKQEEAKHKAEELAKKQQKNQAKMGFNPAMMQAPPPPRG